MRQDGVTGFASCLAGLHLKLEYSLGARSAWIKIDFFIQISLSMQSLVFTLYS